MLFELRNCFFRFPFSSSLLKPLAVAALLPVLFAVATVAQTTPGHPIERVFVEPFTTRDGAEQFRADLIQQLRKVSSISLAADEAGADAVVAGGGEIWIKGYRSHNPQLGSVAANGTPIYSGFLSIELRDKAGQTLWSYLATPPAASKDVSKDLATVIVTKLSDALDEIRQQAALNGRGNGDAVALAQPTVVLSGAGATFPFPVYEKWFTNYRHENPTVEIQYEPIGSAAGIQKLLANSVDFGGSDSPEVIHDLAPMDDDKYIFFPSVVGAVVPVVNLPGLPGDLAFTPEALAGIYLGKIRKWNDPILARSNHNLRLPDLDIVVVHRADGSGTSYAWTDFLSKTDPRWKSVVGTSLTPKWPIGREADGNDGVSKMVKDQPGSIGYVEFIYALKNHLDYARVRNRNGEFVSASLEGIAAAASHSARLSRDFKISIADAPGPGAYPISSFTWIIVPKQIMDANKRTAIADFLDWMLSPGQRQAAALGYLPISADLSKQEMAAIAKMR